MIKYFEYDIFEEVLINHLRDINNENALENNEKYIEDLHNEMIEAFHSDIRDHFLIVPMQQSYLENNIIFGALFFLKQRSDEDDYISDISRYLGVEFNKVKSSIDHTHITRSKDFLKRQYHDI